MRPNCHWTFRQSLSRALLVYFGKYAATVELKTPHSLEAGTEKGRFVVIQPVKGDLYCDILLCDPTIRPGPVGAVWHTKPITHPGHHQRGQRVFFHLRGGAYVLGDGRDVSTKFMSSLLRQSWPGSAIFCPVYRLSSAPGGRFPAAFQDAVTAYSFLVHDLHIPHQDIVLSGDSAGAHLAIALLRYISVDVADERPATHVDHAAPELIPWTYRGFLPRSETGVAHSDPYLSPVTAAIPTEVPIWGAVGRCRNTEAGDQKNSYTCRGPSSPSILGIGEPALENMKFRMSPHDIVTLAPIIGWESEAAEAVREAISFLDECLAE